MSVDSNALKDLRLLEASDLSSTTGRKTWNAALVAKEYLQRRGDLSSLTVIDISSGNGYLAIALALIGTKRVYATECPNCIRLLEANLDENFRDIPADPVAIEYSWGDCVSKICSKVALSDLHLVIFSDLLYITFRDAIEGLFEKTLLDLLPNGDSNTQGLFCYETRLTDREQQFIDGFLSEHFVVNEIDCDKEHLLDACRETEQGDVDCGELSIFYQPPPVRLLLLKRKA